jgi:hypothetical protein
VVAHLGACGGAVAFRPPTEARGGSRVGVRRRGVRKTRRARVSVVTTPERVPARAVATASHERRRHRPSLGTRETNIRKRRARRDERFFPRTPTNDD